MPAATPRKTKTTTVTTKPRAKGDVSLRQGSILKSKPPTREECEKAYRVIHSMLDLKTADGKMIGQMIFQGMFD